MVTLEINTTYFNKNDCDGAVLLPSAMKHFIYQHELTLYKHRNTYLLRINAANQVSTNSGTLPERSSLLSYLTPSSPQCVHISLISVDRRISAKCGDGLLRSNDVLESQRLLLLSSDFHRKSMFIIYKLKKKQKEFLRVGVKGIIVVPQTAILALSPYLRKC